MQFLAIVVVVLLILAVVGILLGHRRGRRQGAPGNLPFVAIESFLTPAERSLFEVLRPIAEAEGLFIFAKVRLADIFLVSRGTEGRQGFQNKIQQKHVDFLMCQKQTLAPALAVELDDASHGRADRQQRDVLVNEIFATAGLPLLRVPAKAGYVPNQLTETVRAKLGARASADNVSS